MSSTLEEHEHEHDLDHDSALISLNDSLLEEILSYNDVLDIVNLTRVSKQLYNTITSNDAIWQVLCQRVWLIDSTRMNQYNENEREHADINAATTCTSSSSSAISMSSNSSYYTAFMTHLNEYSPSAITAYASVKGWWNRMESYLARYHPQAYLSLQPPASKQQIKDIVRQYAKCGYNIPIEWQLLYRIHNGQTPTQISTSATNGIFGHIRFYDSMYIIAITKSVALIHALKFITLGDVTNIMYILCILFCFLPSQQSNIQYL
jgi:hypothetical protein